MSGPFRGWGIFLTHTVGFLLSADPNITDLLQEDHPEIPGEIEVW